ncbi:hypothetical protein N8303_02545 [Gammaproteobacteria bacterium]|jgi:hypothetical protein|nr:hypothetical protein [Gammaproteobacteria bacterium]
MSLNMEVRGTKLFIEYISRKLNLSEEERPVLGNWGQVGTTLGSLSLKLNLMDMDKINNLLEIQEQSGGLFGDVAIELGYLDAMQVESLLKIQTWSRRGEILHRLLLSKKINTDQYRELVSKVYFF